ncbi:MAG: hypothetical protein AAF480_08045 [Actinomycetota bacterium]
MKRSSDTIEQLRLEAGRLWDAPVPDDGRREELLTELVDIETDLDRLGLRAEISPAQDREIARCARRLDRLRSRWAVAA